MGVGQKTHMFKKTDALGACCNYGGGGTAFCFNTTSSDCAAAGGSHQGLGTYCGDSGVCAAALSCCDTVGASGCGFTCDGTGASACDCNDCGSAMCWDCATVNAVFNVYCFADPGCGVGVLLRTCNITFDVTDVSSSVCTFNAAGNSITWKTCGAASESGDCIWVKLDLDHNEAAEGTALPWTWGIDNSASSSSVCWSDPGVGEGPCTSDGPCISTCAAAACGSYGPNDKVSVNSCLAYQQESCFSTTCYTKMAITLNCG